MSQKKTLISNILWLFFDKGYGALLTLYIFSLIANYFGTELFGVWNYIIAFSALITALGSLGLNFVIVKNIKQRPILSNLIIGNTLILRMLAGVFFSLILLFLYYVIGVNTEKTYIYVVIFIFLSQVTLNTNVLIYRNEAYLDNKNTVIARNLSLTICSIIRFVLIKHQYGIIYFALANLLEYTLFFLFSMHLDKRKIRSFELKLNKKISLTLSKQGLPLMLSAVVVILYLKIDQLIIAYLIGNDEVGVYSAASRIAEMLYALPVIISNVFFPRILEFRNNLMKRDEILKELYGIVIISSILIALFVSVFSEVIILKLYGNEYINSVEVLIIYSWSILFMGLLVSSSKFLLVIERNDIIFKRGVLGLLFNVLLNFLLIPNYGIQGAAWATLVSYSIAAYFSNVFFKDLRLIMLSQLMSVFHLFSIKYLKKKLRQLF